MKEICKFEKNSRDTIKASIGEYKGKPIVDFRVYCENSDGEEIPTRKGLTISPEVLPEFFDMVKKTLDAVKRENKDNGA